MIKKFDIYLKENLDYFPDRTSLSQISFGLKVLVNKIRNYEIKEIETNLDYGGGRYDLGTKYLAQYGITNLIYDKYSRTEEHNNKVLQQVKELGGVDSVTLLNVLNTIREKETRINVIKDAYGFLKPGGVFIISIYKGDKTGEGKLSSKNTWQENRRTSSYVDEIKEAIGDVEMEVTTLYIMIKKPEILKEGFQLKTEKGSIIKRSKYGVGKDIGDSIYVAERYAHYIMDIDTLREFILRPRENPNWHKIYYPGRHNHIYKIKKDFSSLSIINSPDFDESDEPYIKNWLKIDKDGTVKYGESDPDNPPIYHHKWLFVKDNYAGFNVENSKKRSALWLSIPNIDFTRIGYKKYWEENVVPKIEELEKEDKIKKYDKYKNIDPYSEENWENESIHSDIDPYGEEDWDEDYDFKVGDIVVCIDDDRSGGVQGLKNGRKYIITKEYTREGGNTKYVDVRDLNTGRVLEYFFKDRFKKIQLNEAHEDVDPYGEEEWDELKPGDMVVCLRDENANGITKGKIYKYLGLSYNGYAVIMNDYHFSAPYMNDRFKKVN